MNDYEKDQDEILKVLSDVIDNVSEVNGHALDNRNMIKEFALLVKDAIKDLSERVAEMHSQTLKNKEDIENLKDLIPVDWYSAGLDQIEKDKLKKEEGR